MMGDGYDAAWFLLKVFSITGLDKLRPMLTGDDARSRLAARIRAGIRDKALNLLVSRLAASTTFEHRDIAAELATAVEAEDYEAALAMVATAGRRRLLRAEKMVSRRYGFFWLCNPKVASRSIIAALRSADPDAELIRNQTLDEIFTARPEAKGYYSFAFLRHPCHRTFSFYADKHVKLGQSPEASRRFIEPFYGLRKGMTFSEFCRWLNTPYGSDVFADRHWLSQHLQIRVAGGRLPDFVGSYEHLDADWRMVTERLGMPFRELPRLNARPAGMLIEEYLDDDTVALLRRRYADDFRLGGYEADDHYAATSVDAHPADGGP